MMQTSFMSCSVKFLNKVAWKLQKCIPKYGCMEATKTQANCGNIISEKVLARETRFLQSLERLKYRLLLL